MVVKEQDSPPRAPERSDDNSQCHHSLDAKLDHQLTPLLLDHSRVQRELTSYDKLVLLQALDILGQRLVVYLRPRFQRR
jgi:hypothetical protein